MEPAIIDGVAFTILMVRARMALLLLWNDAYLLNYIQRAAVATKTCTIIH